MAIASNGLKNGKFHVNAEENNENTKTISFKTSMMKILTEKQKVPDKNNKSKEIVIVGGGVSGLSTAWTLAKLGHNVTLFERETIGAFSQASSINSGFLHTEPTTDPYGKDDWNSFSSSLSMTVYKYLDTCCPAKVGA